MNATEITMKSKIIMGIKTGIAVLAFHLVGTTLTEAFAFVLMQSNMDNDLMKDLYIIISSAITVFLSFPIFVLVMRIWGCLKPFHLICTGKMNVRSHLFCFLLSALPMCILYVIEIYLLKNGLMAAEDLINTEPLSLLHIIIFSCFLMPVMEELMFRGILLHALLPYGKVYAIVMTTIYFTIGHLNPVNMLLSVIPGLVFAFVAVRMKGIQYGVYYHIGINLLGQLVIPLCIVLL